METVKFEQGNGKLIHVDWSGVKDESFEYFFFKGDSKKKKDLQHLFAPNFYCYDARRYVIKHKQYANRPIEVIYYFLSMEVKAR